MFDIMKFASDNHVEVDVRPGTRPVVWEFFLGTEAWTSSSSLRSSTVIWSASTMWISIWRSALTA